MSSLRPSTDTKFESMMRLHFAGPAAHPFIEVLVSLQEIDKAEVIGTTDTAASTSAALSSTQIDAVLFPANWIDIMRTIRTSTESDIDPTLIVMTERHSKPALVRALACGFDGAIHIDAGPSSAAEQISHILDGTWSFETEPAIDGLALSRGLLARRLKFADADDEHIADLAGIGLPDEDIAFFMDWTVQRVRNRIERLLVENDLAYRTQLAVVRAASLKVPDFS